MAAVESTGTSSEIQEQYEKLKSLLGEFFIFPSFYIFSLAYLHRSDMLE